MAYAYVYILSGDSKRLYMGLTAQLEVRIAQHKQEAFPNSHSAKYNLKRLVYLEPFADIQEAIAREKQLKKWSRVKKVQLIVRANPDWRDLSADWGKPCEPFNGTLRPPTTF